VVRVELGLNLGRKRRLDWVLGGTLIGLLRPAVLALGRILRRDHRLRLGGRLCVFKLLGGGSLVIAFPARLGLRRQHPEVELTLLCTPSVAMFAGTLGVFDRLIVIDDSSVLRLLRTALLAWFRLLGTDTVVDLEVHSRLSTVYSLLTCARNRIGFYVESAFWRQGLHTHLVFFNRFSGSYLFYEKLFELFGAEPATVEACRTHLLQTLPPLPPTTEPTLCIGHACSDLSRERMLSPEQWAQVLRENAADGMPRRIVLLGSRADRDDADRILAALRLERPDHSYENRCGELSLLESVATIASADEFWGIDSGLLHYARLLRKRCLSFWGPTHPDTLLKPIPALDERVVYRRVPCSPCVHIAELPPCRGNNVCIRNLFARGSTQEAEWFSYLEPGTPRTSQTPRSA
jgi:ADP-heptose:LPS heptosyltransferase